MGFCFILFFCIGNTMSLQLSPTTFATGIKDKLAPVDVYTQKSAKNPVDDIALDVNVDPTTLQGLMGGNLALPVSLIASYSKAKGISISTSALLTGLIGSNPALVSAMGSLNKMTATAVLTATGNANITATIGGVAAKVNTSDLSNLTGVAALIGGISGTAYPISFTDNTGLTNLSVNLLVQANSLGIPNAYTQIANGLLGNPVLLQNVTKAILPSVIQTSNTNMLNNIAHGPAVATVQANNPAFISNYAASYTLPPNAPQSQLPSIGKQITTAFTAINPNWNKSTTNLGIVINNNSVLSGASPDFTTLMSAAQATATTPPIVTPTVTVVQTAAQATATPLPPLPTGGTTSTTTTVIEPDGTVAHITTTVWPDETINTETLYADGSLESEMSYPPQHTPNPSPAVTSNACLLPLTTLPYTPDTSILTDTQVIPFTTGITNLTTNTFPPGSLSTSSLVDNGNSCVNTTLPNATTYQIETAPSATTTTTLLPLADPTLLTEALSIPGDPLASTSTAIYNDPLALGGVMNDFTTSSIDSALTNNTPNLLTADASDALSTTFPDTNLTGLSSFDSSLW